MTRPDHQAARFRRRAWLVAALVGAILATVVFFTAGLVLLGLLATLVGLVTVAIASRYARPAHWIREDRGPEGR